MKLVVWGEEDEPWDSVVDSDGDIIFYDSPSILNLQVGDQIQYPNAFEVACYIVAAVEPATPFNGIGTQVRIRAMEA